MVAAVNNLPAAQKINQFASHSSHFYCSICTCFHLTTLGCTDYEDWHLKDVDELCKNAKAWKNAPTRKEQEKLFTVTGVQWSELWQLPYWNPQQMLIVDPMHCLLEGLAQFHFRDVLQLTDAIANKKVEVPDAFSFDFPMPSATTSIQLSDLKAHKLKHITQLQSWLLSPLANSSPEIISSLLKHQFNKNPLIYVAESLGLVAHNSYGGTKSLINKRQWALALANWVRVHLPDLFSHINLLLYVATSVSLVIHHPVCSKACNPRSHGAYSRSDQGHGDSIMA